MAFKSPINLMRLLMLTVSFGTVVIVMLPMWRGNYPHTHSFHFNMMWAFQYGKQFWSGQFYPRWLEGSYFGLGNPTFSFYPPLCMVATLPFIWLGTGKALVASMTLATLVRAWGSYWAARHLWSAPLALAVLITAVVAPYFVLDSYQRGAIAEVWGLSLMPWVVGAGLGLTQRILAGGTTRFWSLGLGVAYGFLGLTHLPMLLVWTLVWLVWPLCFLPSISLGSLRSLLRLGIPFYGSTLMGLLGISFFLGPAILDQPFVDINLINGWDIYDPLQRFMIYVSPWLQSTDNHDQVLLPHFWEPLVILLITIPCALLSLSKVPQSDLFRLQGDQEGNTKVPGIPDASSLNQQMQKGLLIFLVLSTLIASFMMTSLSTPLYQWSSSLTRIQFPWRWMGVTASIMPFCFGYLWQGIVRLQGYAVVSTRRWLQGVGSLCILGCMAWLTNQGLLYTQQALYNPSLVSRFESLMTLRPPFPKEPTISAQEGEQFLGWHWEYPEGLAFVDAFEYRPMSGRGNPIPPPQTYALVDWQQGSGEIDIKTWRYGQRILTIRPQAASEPVVLTLRMFAYPGWQVQSGRHLLAADRIQAATDGRLQLTLDPIPTQLIITYVGTAAERWGTTLSIGCCVLLGILALSPRIFAIPNPTVPAPPLPLLSGQKGATD